MAVDEAVLEFSAQKISPPTLRLYAWQPPCLSLGYAQNLSDVLPQALDHLGWQIVRRPTGGRAILHTDELTYAVIAPQDNPLVAGSVLDSYCRLSAALLRALTILGLRASADRSYPQAPPPGPVCFETPSNYEITAGGKKLIGSAQSRRLQGVLQHGSLPLHGDLARITRALAFPSESDRQDAALRLLEHAATLEQVLGCRISWQTAARAFQQAFMETFDLQFEESDLSPAEEARAFELCASKYASPLWTNRL